MWQFSYRTKSEISTTIQHHMEVSADKNLLRIALISPVVIFLAAPWWLIISLFIIGGIAQLGVNKYVGQ